MSTASPQLVFAALHNVEVTYSKVKSRVKGFIQTLCVNTAIHAVCSVRAKKECILCVRLWTMRMCLHSSCMHITTVHVLCINYTYAQNNTLPGFAL